ncbi:MAG: hypothetical protein WD555_06455, partial [Fulvivirga sp.]
HKTEQPFLPFLQLQWRPKVRSRPIADLQNIRMRQRCNIINKRYWKLSTYPQLLTKEKRSKKEKVTTIIIIVILNLYS